MAGRDSDNWENSGNDQRRPRGHQQGAFRNLNGAPHDSAGKSHAGMHYNHPSGGVGISGKDLSNSSKASGLNGKLNDLAKGIGEVGKKDPNLERLGNAFGAGKSLAGDLPKSDRESDGKSDMPGLTDPHDHKGMKSGLADPDKEPKNQRGDPNKQPAGNGIGDQDDSDPLKKYGSSVPQQLANLGGKVNKTYNKFMGGLAGGVRKAGKLLNLSVGKGASMYIAKILMCSTLGGLMLGGAYLYQNNDDVLFGGNVCSTQNTGDESYEGSSKSGATNSDWLSSPALKDVIKFFKAKGFSGIAISGIIGSIGRESHGDPHIIQGGGDTDNPKTVTGATGTHGYGLFQISPGSKYGNWSGFKKGASAWNQCEYIWSAYGGAACSAGVRSDPADAKKLAHAKSPAEAAFYWYYMVEDHVGLPSSYDAKSDREAYAQQAYSHFKLSSIKGDDSKLNSLLGSGNESAASANSDTAEQANNVQCEGKDSDTTDAHGVAGYAKAMIGWFNYSEGQRTDFAKDGDWKNISKLSQVNKDGHVDCTSFSWLCGRLAGFEMNGNNWPWTTQALSDPAAAGCKEITNKHDVKPGDFGLNGQHGVVVVGNYDGGNTDCCDCGYDHVRHHSLAECYTGAGGWQSVRFFRPVKRR